MIWFSPATRSLLSWTASATFSPALATSVTALAQGEAPLNRPQSQERKPLI